MMAYIAAVAAHPAYTARFQADLVQPGLRIPLTADGGAVRRSGRARPRGDLAAHVRRALRRPEDTAGRPGPPRLPHGTRPAIPTDGAIPNDAGAHARRDRLRCPQASACCRGRATSKTCRPRVWAYEVSGKQVLTQWFSYRKANRERPIIGDRRQPSKLGDIQPDHWLAEYTTELINVLNVLGRTRRAGTGQRRLLERSLLRAD